MSTSKSLPPREPEASDVTRVASEASLIKDLGELVDNDSNAPYVVSQRSTLFFGLRQWLKFGGHFPSGVAFFAIAVLGSTVFLCSDVAQSKSSRETLPVVGLFLGGALIAQVIDTRKKQH